MSQLENKKSPLELHKMFIADLLGPVGGKDFKLGHDFHETAQEVRFTMSESARREEEQKL